MKITLLPLDANPSTAAKQHASEACGFPLQWVLAWDGVGSLREYLENFCTFAVGGSISEEGVFQYPQDPDMPPLVKVEFEGLTYYQYDHGYIAIVGETTYITRID